MDGLRHEKIIQKAWKINKTSKSLVERLVDFKYMPCQCWVQLYALSVLGTLGPYPHSVRQLSRKNPTRYNVPLLVPTMLFLLTSNERIRVRSR